MHRKPTATSQMPNRKTSVHWEQAIMVTIYWVSLVTFYNAQVNFNQIDNDPEKSNVAAIGPVTGQLSAPDQRWGNQLPTKDK